MRASIPWLAGGESRKRGLPRWVRALWPLDSAKNEIRALDGVRALAALSIVAYHILLLRHIEFTAQSKAIDNIWYYLSTGVQLFFVLSGFLLFRPYAQAMLTGRPWPSWTRFYKRRALRILPAYWVVLAVVAVSASQMASPRWENLLTHSLLLHDIFPLYNRDLDGPMWTLAVEWQFYLLLPWMAAAVGALVGRSRALWRVVAGLLLLIAAAVALRVVDVAVLATLPAQHALQPNGGDALRWWFTLVTMGSQGKFFEVFAVGMLAATLYVAIVERDLLGARRRELGWIALGVGVAATAVALPQWRYADQLFTLGVHWDWNAVLYPLLVGIGYGGLVLGLTLGPRLLRAPLECWPLRFVGLISFSLYLWHLPVLAKTLPEFANVPLWQRLIWAFVISYLSYELVERPFLRRRLKMGERRGPSQAAMQALPRERLAIAESAQSAP